MNLKLERTPGIYFVGFMGCGKSTIGRLYAEEIGWRFADTDDDIESATGMQISDFFATRGEEEFRRMETEAITRRVQAVRRGSPIVLSLGGGAFSRESNVELLNENGVTVWVDTPFDVMKQRVAQADHRPLARDPVRFRTLYDQRRPLYERAEIHLPVPDGNSRNALRSLLSLCLLD